jgi:hypothetical protein
MVKRIKMKIIQYILRILALCAGISALCSFIPVYAHAYPKFICLTNVLLVCPTLKPPSIWQLGKYRLRRGRRSLLSSRRAQRTHKDPTVLSLSRKWLFREDKKKQATLRIFSQCEMIFGIK